MIGHLPLVVILHQKRAFKGWYDTDSEINEGYLFAFAPEYFSCKLIYGF